MKFELKNVKFSEVFSQETNCFVADLFVDNKKTANIINEGKGGCTEYHAYPKKEALLKEAEAYALTLPEINCGTFSIKSNLEHTIDGLFEKWLDIKEAKKMVKHFQSGLCYGTKNSYSKVSWRNMTIATMLANPNTSMHLRMKIKELKAQGHEILNTNLPEEFLL